MRVSWSILLLLLFFPSSVRAEEYLDSGSWGPDAPIEPEAAETPKEAVKEKEEEETKEEPKAEANNEAPKPAAEEKEDAEKEKISSPTPDEGNKTASELNDQRPEQGQQIIADEGEKKKGEPSEADPLGFDFNQMEWFSIRFIGGSHGPGVAGSFFTLQGEIFFWTIATGGGTFWPGPGLSVPYNGGANFLFYGGTQPGMRFTLDEMKRHELRYAFGLYAGLIAIDRGSDLNPSRSYGPFVSIMGSYLYHVQRHLSLELGFEFFVATRGEKGDDLAGNTPTPALMGFVGVRF